MRPHIRIFLLQTRRSTKRLVLQLALLCAAVAFFVVSLNLYHNSRANLQTVEDAYSTIATMEFHGYVNRAGEPVTPDAEDLVGLRLLSATEFDLTPLLDLNCVTGVDLRQRYAAYIPGEPAIEDVATGEKFYLREGLVQFFSCFDTLRFTLDIQEPLVIPLETVPAGTGRIPRYFDLPINLIDQTLPQIEYSDKLSLYVTPFLQVELDAYAEDIRRLNRSDSIDAITLYPDVEYVLAGGGGGYFRLEEETGRYAWVISVGTFGNAYMSVQPGGFITYNIGSIVYHGSGVGTYTELVPEGNPYGLQRYEDVCSDAQWQKSVESLEYTNHAFPITLTNDMESIPAWYAGGMYLQDGRMITDEEYASGAKVCMISARMAEYQGWQVGDTLDLHCFPFGGYYEHLGTNSLTSPWYYRELDGFFHTGEYKIVGIFGQQELTDFGDAAEEVFYNPWNTIYVPTNSVENMPEESTRLIRPSTLTIQLKNGSINEFKAAVEEMGLTEQKPGEYEIKFSYFDQGYDKIKPGLDEMNRNAELLLGLSSVLLLVTMVLLAFLFSRQHKPSAGILRLLGGSKKQAFTAILTCAAAVVLVGGMVGAIVGGVLTQSVGASTLGDAVASAKVALSTGASPLLTVLSGIGCVALFLALTAIFTGTYIGKEPRTLLPQDKG